MVRDYDPYPRWTKFFRFLKTNSFEHALYDIQRHDWIERAAEFDVIVGIWSCELCFLQELREKYYFLEKYLGKQTFPSPDHTLLYEDKRLESYIATLHGIPFPKTYISYSKADALRLIEEPPYPFISKSIPSSGSVGVQLIKNKFEAQTVVNQSFSPVGRKIHLTYARQKNYVYFQEFIPNDGYDIRVIVVRNLIFGYYRKTLPGDFRASGMNLVEKRDLPTPAIDLAIRLNEIIRSPILVVDLLHGTDGKFYVIEYSPACQMETPEQFHKDGVPGLLVHDDDGNYRFEAHRYWVHELALREFFLSDYLSKKAMDNLAFPLMSAAAS